MRRRRGIFDRIEELFDRIEELFRPSWDLERCYLEPLIDVEEREDYVVVTADLPCVERKEDIRLDVTEDSLVLEAYMARGFRLDRWGTVQREVEFKSFKKVVRLPAKVDPEGARATFKNGILRVLLPKKVERYVIRVE
ncbi:MAG: Hsp20/alpha crystallin family protein [Candidatus Nezhaarchaeota archaeon]|nr:Hsp20/alpha crystallin family protein [Candidatus Nezhaarchaeota archaeon]